MVIDAFTKFMKLYPIRSQDAKLVEGKIVNNYINEVGHLKMNMSDHGVHFTSVRWKKKGIGRDQGRYTAMYHPQSNMVKRVMRELGQLFRTYCNNKLSTWMDYIKLVKELLNNNKHKSTGYTPVELMCG